MTEVTYLDAVPVRYSYTTPSMSRRGGVRLHPVKDGIMLMPWERGIQTRDQVGNKLRDVINPRTGFCMGVVSPILGGQVNQGTSGSPTVEVCRGMVTKHAGLYHDQDGRVIRTEAMGDCPLPTSKRNRDRSTGTNTRSADRSGRSSAASARTPDMRNVPGGTGRNGSITRADVLAFIKAMAKGRPVQVTPQVYALAKAALEARRAEAARRMAQ